MKHNEQARLVPLDLAFTYPSVHKKNATRTPRANLLDWRLFRLLAVVGLSGLARSARLDPSACYLNARSARSPTKSALFISLVSRFCRTGENSQQKRETAHNPLF